MTDYSMFVFFFLLLPVTLQIILPLLMLVGFGLICFLRTVFGRSKVRGDMKDGIDIPEGFQVGRS